MWFFASIDAVPHAVLHAGSARRNQIVVKTPRRFGLTMMTTGLAKPTTQQCRFG